MARAARRIRPAYITTVEGRIHAVLPGWPVWTRRLRRIYILLETYGPTDDAIKEMCADFHWDLDETLALMRDTTSFRNALEDYRQNECYPTMPTWNRGGIKGLELQTLYAYESGIVQFMHLEDRRGQGSFGVKLAESTGLLGIEPELTDGRDREEQPPEEALPDWSELGTGKNGKGGALEGGVEASSQPEEPASRQPERDGGRLRP
jgi:hypothetical protein